MKKRLKMLALLSLVLMSALTLSACTMLKNSDDSNWGEWVVMTSATCEVDGIEMRVSKTNGEITETRSVAALGHDCDFFLTTNDPTCLVAGFETWVCKDCGNADVRSIPALGHKWGEWFVSTEPTCTTHGIETRICEHDDHHTDIRSASMLGCDWSEWVITTAPTCTDAGIEAKFCRNDNAHFETRPVTELGHDWSDWVYTITPTETTDGEEMRVCRNNKDHIETRVAHATGTPELEYRLVSNGTAYLVGFFGGTPSRWVVAPVSSIIIPVYHNGLPVRLIGFRFITGLESVTFLDGSLITTFANGAFWNCVDLKSIVIPASVTHFGNAVFWGTSLESIVFEQDIFVEFFGQGMFRDCTSLKSIVIPAGVTYVGRLAFMNWTAEQTIYVKGFSSEAEADEAWGWRWREDCNATIIYLG